MYLSITACRHFTCIISQVKLDLTQPLLPKINVSSTEWPFFFLHRIPFCLYHLYLNFIAIENYALSSLFLYPFSRSQYVIHEARAHGSQKLWLALYPFPHSWNNSQVSSISVRNTFSTSCPTSLKRLPTTISKSKRRKKIDLPVTMASGLYVQPAGSRGQRSDYVVKWSLQLYHRKCISFLKHSDVCLFYVSAFTVQTVHLKIL